MIVKLKKPPKAPSPFNLPPPNVLPPEPKKVRPPSAIDTLQETPLLSLLLCHPPPKNNCPLRYKAPLKPASKPSTIPVFYKQIFQACISTNKLEHRNISSEYIYCSGSQFGVTYIFTINVKR